MANVNTVYDFTFQNAAVATGVGNLMDVGGLSMVAVQIVGITTATVTFQAQLDEVPTWVNVFAYKVGGVNALSTTATADGIYLVRCPGYSQIRCNITAWTSGTITIKGKGLVNTVIEFPLINVSTEGQKQTYSSSVTGFVPVATPTDFFNMFGSASKTIRITRLEVCGTATAASAYEILLFKRSSSGTLGSAAKTALTKVPHDSQNAAGTGIPNTIGTANYTTLGTVVGQLSAKTLKLPPLSASGIAPDTLVWDFTNRNEQGIVLRGANAEQIALSGNGVALPAGIALDINITWTEE